LITSVGGIAARSAMKFSAFKSLSRVVLAAGFLTAAALAHAEPNRLRNVPSWVWFMPGGGQYALGQDARAAAYLSSTAGFAWWGVNAEKHRASGQMNAPLVYAQQAYILSLYESYRDVQMLYGADRYNRRFDPAPLSKMFAAPFERKQLTSPWVIGAAVAGAGINYAIARSVSHPRTFSGMSSFNYLGDTYNRDTGAAVYSAYWIPLSIGAGVSEEALFRGIIQSDWENRWGQKNGHIAASAVFGLAHLNDPSDPAVVANALFAFGAGYYFGWRYQQNNYKLAENIAAHVWFDLAAGAALMLANPQENPLGAKIEYAF